MQTPRSHSAVVIALYVNAALLLAVLVALVSGNRLPAVLPEAYAAPPAPVPIAGGGGIYLMPAQFTSKSWGCYLMDVDAQTLCVYQYFEGETKLRLVAARTFRNDRLLQRFNTDKPDPAEVLKLVEMERAGRRDNPQAPVQPGGEDAAQP